MGHALEVIRGVGVLRENTDSRTNDLTPRGASHTVTLYFKEDTYLDADQPFLAIKMPFFSNGVIPTSF